MLFPLMDGAPDKGAPPDGKDRSARDENALPAKLVACCTAPRPTRPAAINEPAPARAKVPAVAPRAATCIGGLSRSPPENAGEPPITDEMSFGDIHARAMKIRHAPMMSKALIAGCWD
jgi:hypothetical protein